MRFLIGYCSGYLEVLAEYNVKRLLIVYNPHSSQYEKVRREVLDKVTRKGGYMVGKYEIEATSIDDNISKLKKILREGDLVITAGGDATGVIAANAILQAGVEATLAVLPYGNFNDLSRTLGVKRVDSVFDALTRVEKYYPLAIYVNDKLVRYATSYVTIGMMAESVTIYDEPKARRKLKTNFGRKVGSYLMVAGWYFKNRHKKKFLPEFTINGQAALAGASDYIAVNGKYMARVMRGEGTFLDPARFKSGVYKLTGFWRLSVLMARSMLVRVPGGETSGDEICFVKPSKVTVQAEGESLEFSDAKKIEIRKAEKYLKVIVL